MTGMSGMFGRPFDMTLLGIPMVNVQIMYHSRRKNEWRIEILHEWAS